MEAQYDKYIIVFASHSQAAFIYSELQKKGLQIEFLSTPAKIASGCSKSIIFSYEDIRIVVTAVENINANINGIYKIEKNNSQYDYIKV